MLSAWTTPEKRNDLAQRLKTAGCEVDTSGTDWLKAGDFTAAKVADGPIGRRIPGAAPTKRRHPGTRPIIIHPAAVDESMASVVETRGHTPVGQLDLERLPCREMTKVCRELSRPTTALSMILFLRDPSSEFLAPSEFSATRFTKINRSVLAEKAEQTHVLDRHIPLDHLVPGAHPSVRARNPRDCRSQPAQA